MIAQNFDIQGHRGSRGLMPENTIPAFLKALELGVNTLELDVVVSRDKQLVVSHEPWLNDELTLDKNGNPISRDNHSRYNLYKMDYAEIKQFDCGSMGNEKFPNQKKIKTYKPLLKEVFMKTQNFIKEHNLQTVRYNIEMKFEPDGDNIYNPAPDVFAKMVYNEIVTDKMENQVNVQSFDVRGLQEFKKIGSKIPMSLLVENSDGIEKNIEKLGFQPEIYSPYFKLLDEKTIRYCKEKGIKIIPWTVNDAVDMEALKKMNLEGIITDYPDRAIEVFRKK